jgi:HEAT repeat protein
LPLCVRTAVFDAAGAARSVVRHAAAVVLGHSRGDAALKKLALLSRDESPAVRKEAVWGMSAFGGDTADDARAFVELIAYDAERRGRNDRFEALQGLARTERAPDLDKLLAVAAGDKDAVLRVVAARTSIVRGDARALTSLAALLDVKDLEGPDGDEEAAFVRHTAEVVLCDVGGVAQGVRTSADWRRAIPEVAARLAKRRESDTHPPRLAQRW